MTAGVMRDAVALDLIETAGIELDRTLMAFDYLNGEPVGTLDGPVADPIGPSGAAAAFERRRVSGGRRIRREAFRVPGGRGPGPAPEARGRVVSAGEDGPRDP